MPHAKLPERASLEYLKKLAKDRLRAMRGADPNVKLAAAQLAIARDHGFSSWRALKAEVERRATDPAHRFLDACAAGDAESVAALLAEHPALATAVDDRRTHDGWTALHTAAFAGRATVVRLLLRHGADPHAREQGDNTTPLHWAAARSDPDTVRALLDVGADAQATGDVHELEVIGWATLFRSEQDIVPEVLALLEARGARHHVFSAIAAGDPALVLAVVRRDPSALERRLSRFEHGRSPLHYAIERKRPDLAEMLVEAGADPNALDLHGQTPLAVALTHGEAALARLLRAKGATLPPTRPPAEIRERLATLARATRKGVAMIGVPDIAAALRWYTSIGFTEVERYAEDGLVNFGMVTFGQAELMFGIHPAPNAENVRLWFYTEEVDALYELLKARQLGEAQEVMDGRPLGDEAIRFDEELYDPFYGGRQFSIRDPFGYTLIFYRAS
ncbi:MAG TPA: ankyrin repeat domain-containing protein [Gemmatimonadaceae bacterium]|nr:ankyrin repeat domain-containing protein [Gemmatimonadaceae bacterium]